MWVLKECDMKGNICYHCKGRAVHIRLLLTDIQCLIGTPMKGFHIFGCLLKLEQRAIQWTEFNQTKVNSKSLQSCAL